jgi:hypothetical protein
MMLYVSCSTTRIQQLSKACDSNFEETCYGSGEPGRIRAREPQTGAVQAIGKEIRSLDPFSFAPVA